MDQKWPPKGSSLFSRGEHQFLDLLHGPESAVAHARSTESNKRLFCCAVTSCFPVVPRSSFLSKMKVMNEQKSEQGFPMVPMCTRAISDFQGWPQVIKHGPESCRGGRLKHFLIFPASEFTCGESAFPLFLGTCRPLPVLLLLDLKCEQGSVSDFCQIRIKPNLKCKFRLSCLSPFK